MEGGMTVSTTEFEGKNVEAALKKASSALNIPVEELRYEVVTVGSSGIFGLVGVKNAKIRILDIDTQDGGDSKRSVSAEDRQEIMSMIDEAFSDKKRPVRGKAQEKKPAAGKRKRKQAASEGREQKEPAPQAQPSFADTGKPGGEKSRPAIREPDIEQALEILQKMADLVTSDARAVGSIENGRVLFSIEGGNTSVLIGKRGKTLKAMQHIIEKVVRKRLGEAVDVRVDVANYLEKRENALKSLAGKLAEKARQSGKPTTVSRIDSYERKIIHDALREDKSVKTRSVGSGDFRRVVIQPGRTPQRKKGAR